MKTLTWSPVALALAMALPASAEILITEYVEGSSNNKAIELTNTGTSSASLDDLSLKISFNSNTTYGATIPLSGSLAAGESYVLANSNSPQLSAIAQQTSSSLTFNGNDAVALVDSRDNVLDSLGQLGNNSNFAQNVTLRRIDGSTGRTDPTTDFDASAEWQSFATDTFDGLGCSGVEACDGNGGGGNTFSCEGETLTPTYAIQGSGDRSPLVPDGSFEADGTYYTEGVVTAVTTSLYKGFWLQDATGDGDTSTSDGLFVYTGSAPDGIEPGMQVCVAGTVKEYFNLTELDASAKQWEVIDTVGELAATELEVEEGETLDDALERYEGMKVRLTQDSALVVTRNFGFDYDAFRNNMVLSHQAPNVKPTQLYIAGSDEAAALAFANDANQLFIETDQKAPDGVVPYFPGLDADQGYIRIGDTVTNMEGVIGYSFSDYRLVVTNELVASDFVREEDRTAAPQDFAGTNLKVASFNVLNYFTSASAIGGDLNITCADQNDADNGSCNRGTQDAAEFELQRAKIVNALTAMNADIVGLMEIENNGFGGNGALANLVTELNAQFADDADHYTYITPAVTDLAEGAFLGTDAIQVALIYRPARVGLKGEAVVVRMPEQHISGDSPGGETRQLDKYQRDSLMQTFSLARGEALTVAVSHFKSKGSGCYEDWVAGEFDDDPADLQGRCNEFRVSAAETLGNALADVKGDVIALGDFNAYAQEDPMHVLTDYDAASAERKIVTAAGTSIAGVTLDDTAREVGNGFGYINLAGFALGDDAFSYSFDGELGSLDHAVGNTSVLEKVTGVEDWHINAVESTLFEYSSRFTGDLVKSTNPYSSSDHDPVVISLNYPDKPQKFKLRFKNKTFFWVQPTVNGYADKFRPWLRGFGNRKYDQDSGFFSRLGVQYGDSVEVGYRIWGLFEIPCGTTTLDTNTRAVLRGWQCKLK